MKKASSIAYAGLLIDADEIKAIEEANDETIEAIFNRMKLVCPICHAEVFFVSKCDREEHKRKIRDKEGKIKRVVSVRGSTISDHFNHHRTNTVCENRVASFSKSQIDRINAQSKGQRLKVFRGSFWRILRTCHLLATWEEDIIFFREGFQIYYDKKSIDPEIYYNNFINALISNLKHKKEEIKESIRSLIQNLPHLIDTEWFNGLDAITKSAIVRLNSKFEVGMHTKVAIEALEYVLSDRQNPILLDLVKSACAVLADAPDEIDLSRFKNSSDPLFDIGQEVFLNLIQAKLSEERIVRLVNNCHTTLKTVLELPFQAISAIVELRIASILALTPWSRAFELEHEKKLQQALTTPKINISKGIWVQHLFDSEVRYLSPFSIPDHVIDMFCTTINQAFRNKKTYFRVPKYPFICNVSFFDGLVFIDFLDDTPENIEKIEQKERPSFMNVALLGSLFFTKEDARAYYERVIPELREFCTHVFTDLEDDCTDEDRQNAEECLDFMEEMIDRVEKQELSRFPMQFLCPINPTLLHKKSGFTNVAKVVVYCLMLSALDGKNGLFRAKFQYLEEEIL